MKLKEKYSLDDLKKAGQELQKVCQFDDPPLRTKGKEWDEMVESLEVAGKQVYTKEEYPDEYDEISEETETLLKDFGFWPGSGKEQPEADEDTTEDAQEVDLNAEINNATTLKELKNIAKSYDEFKNLRDELTKYRSKNDMRKALYDALENQEEEEQDTEPTEEEIYHEIEAAEKLGELKVLANKYKQFKKIKSKLNSYKGPNAFNSLKSVMMSELHGTPEERARASRDEKRTKTQEKKKPAAKKKTTQEKKKPATKKKKPTGEKSNKAVVYLAWKDGEEDIEKLRGHTKDAVKSATIKNWINRWKDGKALPSIAKVEEAE